MCGWFYGWWNIRKKRRKEMGQVVVVVKQKALRYHKAPITIEEVIRIKKLTDVRLTTSPFGVTEEEYLHDPPIYVGKSVNWKGHKGLGLEGFAKSLIGIGYPIANMEKLAAGLRKAIAISKKCAGIKGVVVWNGRLYPKKCIEQKMIAGKM